MVRNVNITVVAQPEEIDRGQMLQISGSVTSVSDGRNVIASRIFLQIVDSQGKEVWPTSIITKNDSQFTKLISTSELKSNTRYTIRVGINPKMIYQGFTTFKTTKTPIVGLIPLLLTPAFLIPEAVQPHKFKIYRTELDKRVCPICQPHEGKVFPKGSPDLIRIGPPDLGGDTHYGCRCHYDLIGVPFNAAVMKARSIRNAVLVINSIKKHKRKLKMK